MLHDSLEDKLWYLYKAVLDIEDKINQQTVDLTDDELDLLYGILDGLTQDFFTRHIEGRCSLQASLTWSLEKLELLAIKECKQIRELRLKVKFALV